MADDLAQCDCCGEMAPEDDIERRVACGLETYACGRCRGEPQPPDHLTDAEIDAAQRRLQHLFGKDWLEGGDHA